jgi:hypothetical protein
LADRCAILPTGAVDARASAGSNGTVHDVVPIPARTGALLRRTVMVIAGAAQRCGATSEEMLQDQNFDGKVLRERAEV